MLAASEYSLERWKCTSTNWSSSRSATRVSCRVAEITISLLIFPSIAVPFQSARATPGNGDAKQGGISETRRLGQRGLRPSGAGVELSRWNQSNLKRPYERSLER